MLALELEHAAAYMLAGDGMTLAEYRRVWRERLQWIAKGHVYPASVAAALDLSLEAAARDSPAAYDLLCIFSWLAPDRIPRHELLEAGASELPEPLKTAFEDRDRWTEVVASLSRYSLLGREWGGGLVIGYSMHRVVQQVLRDRLIANACGAQWLSFAGDLVDRAFPFVEPEVWAACEALLPHARAIREYVRNIPEPPASLGRLLSQAAIYLRVRGFFIEARDFQNLALESDLRQFGPDHPTVAVSRSNLSAILYSLQEYPPALLQIDQALEVFRKKLPAGHPHTRNAEAWRANILRAMEAPPKVERKSTTA